MQRGRLIRRETFHGPLMDAWLRICACFFVLTLGAVAAGYAVQAMPAWPRLRIVFVTVLLVLSTMLLSECTADSGPAVR